MNTNLNSDSNRRKHAFTSTTSDDRTGSQENEPKFTDREKRWGRVEGEEVEVSRTSLVTSMKKMREMNLNTRLTIKAPVSAISPTNT